MLYNWISQCKLFHSIGSLHCSKIEFPLQRRTNCERGIQDIHLFVYFPYVYQIIEAYQNVTPGQNFEKKSIQEIKGNRKSGHTSQSKSL